MVLWNCIYYLGKWKLNCCNMNLTWLLIVDPGMSASDGHCVLSRTRLIICTPFPNFYLSFCIILSFLHFWFNIIWLYVVIWWEHFHFLNHEVETVIDILFKSPFFYVSFPLLLLTFNELMGQFSVSHNICKI